MKNKCSKVIKGCNYSGTTWAILPVSLRTHGLDCFRDLPKQLFLITMPCFLKYQYFMKWQHGQWLFLRIKLWECPIDLFFRYTSFWLAMLTGQSTLIHRSNFSTSNYLQNQRRTQDLHKHLRWKDLQLKKITAFS